MVGEHKIIKLGTKKYLVINCKNCANNASLGNTACFSCIEKRIFEYKDVDNVIFQKSYRKVLNEESFGVLKDYLNAIRKLPNEEELCDDDYEHYAVFKYKLEEDPIGAILYLNEIKPCRRDSAFFKKVKQILAKTKLWKLINENKGKTKEEIYHIVFKDRIVPGFISFHIEDVKKGKLIESYSVDGSEIKIYESANKLYPIYCITPKELNLSKKNLAILNKAFEELSNEEYDLRKSHAICERVINKVADDLSEEERKILVEILKRYSFGYGIIEVILKDPKIQDVYVDSPGDKPVYVYHQDYEECMTNVILSQEEIEKLSTRFRMLSGRPFDESYPVLHADLKELKVRIAGVTEPMTFNGTGFAFRKHAVKPWTLQKFIANKMISAEAAGLLSFLIDSQQSMLITGPRGSGKTSLLSALLAEIPQKYRIIAIEDTPELPVERLRDLGFNIQHLRIKSTLQREAYEVSAEEALRSALRLGESVLVIGEVRGEEAKSLFEAMRIGAAGNVVFGTIHGSSAYDVWDRIVNDLRVPSTSFKATNFIISCAPIRKGEDIKRHRRVVGITEVLKFWKEDPFHENGFFDLMKYNRKKDILELSKDFKKSYALKEIAEKKGMSISSVVRSIKTRARIKEEIVKASKENPSLLDVKFASLSVNKFLELASMYSYSKVYTKFKKWLLNQQKHFKD
ncbi:MAG: type II/IV secretion system ATPase subunit [Nanoarchaeota archaeon]|nr:type II/IV secretion system ATPase subunit [Nanoarchaeota archaeon]